MKIDVCIINYNSNWLLEQQILHWRHYMKGSFNLHLIENTPLHLRQPITLPEGELRSNEFLYSITTDYSFDGRSSGEAYDYALRQATSDIVLLIDPDAFLFNPDVLIEVEKDFESGYKCIGAQGFYPDWQRIIDRDFPNFRGDLAPVLWTEFIDRKLALEDTWVCEPPGIGKITGWRTRQKIIDQKIPNKVWMGYFPNPEDNQVCFFGSPDKPQSVHLLKGCSSRAHLMPELLPKYLELGKSEWD